VPLRAGNDGSGAQASAADGERTPTTHKERKISVKGVGRRIRSGKPIGPRDFGGFASPAGGEPHKCQGLSAATRLRSATVAEIL